MKMKLVEMTSSIQKVKVTDAIVITPSDMWLAAENARETPILWICDNDDCTKMTTHKPEAYEVHPVGQDTKVHDMTTCPCGAKRKPYAAIALVEVKP